MLTDKGGGGGGWVNIFYLISDEMIWKVWKAWSEYSFCPKTLTWNNDRSLYAKLAFDEVSTVFDDIIIFAKFCISLELFNLANM